MAHEKGRAKDRALRAVVCRSSAYLLACGFRWSHRYLHSEANPTDWGSRAADRKELRPGQILHGS
eukprot:2138077-Heterocapsa_arctica.AAC.1